MPFSPIYYDLETTGRTPGNDRVVEIALFNSITEQSFVSLVQPQVLIPPEVIKIHGISNEMVKDAPLFVDIIPQILEFCGDSPLLIAHNNDSFDLLFLQREFQIAGIPFPEHWCF